MVYLYLRAEDSRPLEDRYITSQKKFNSKLKHRTIKICKLIKNFKFLIKNPYSLNFDYSHPYISKIGTTFKIPITKINKECYKN